EIVSEIESYQKIIDGARQVVENYKPRIDIDPEWEMVELGDHIDFVSGLTLSIPDCEKIGGTPIISMNSLTEEGELVKEGIRGIELPNKKNINYLKRGDLLFNWRNGSTRLVGKTGYFDWDGVYVFASFLLGIRAHSKSYIPRFLWLLLNQYRYDGMYISFMRQNVNGLFNREELKILKVPLPSIEEQQVIISRIEKEMSLIKSVKELITLNEQKIKDRIGKVWGE
ncbi:MAG: restriction endonuclease subunit S, partial [Bacteroidia bacterium]|nr:restriction endonuclease subunit S [Bacteroidia bacterium]